MTYFTSEQWLPVELPRVFAFFSDPRNLPRIMPPKLHVRIVAARLVPPPEAASDVFRFVAFEDAAGAGSEFVFRFRPLPLLPLAINWHARIEEYEAGRFFRDTQFAGPMGRWSHRHEFHGERRRGVPGTLVRDQVEFEIGSGWAGRIVEQVFVLPAMRAGFSRRQQLVERALASGQ